MFGGKPVKGLFYEPTVLVNVKDDMRIMRDETFGPALPIVIVRNETEAIKKTNDTRYGLTASVWTKNIEKGMKYSRLLDVGTVGINYHGEAAMTPRGAGGRNPALEGLAQKKA